MLPIFKACAQQTESETMGVISSFQEKTKGKQVVSSVPDDRGTKKIKEQSQRSRPGVYHRAGWHLSIAGCHGKTLEMGQREQEVFQSIAADKQEAVARLGRCQHPFSQNRCCHCPLFFVLVPVSSHRMHAE